MQFAVSRLSGFSKQGVKLRPMSQSTANPGDVIVFEMPSNTIIDLRTFSIFSLGTTTAGNGTAASVVLPKHIETLIDSIQVEINGTLVDSGFLGYNQLHKLYMDYLAGIDKNSTMRALMQQGDLAALGHTTTAVTAGVAPTDPPILTSTLVVSRTHTNMPIVFNSFLGFLAAKCPIIDTSILGQVRVLVKLAPASVLVVGGTVAPTIYNYSLNTIFSTIDVISMNDGMYYDMIQQRLAQAPLEIMYDKYYVFQNGLTGPAQSTRWAVSSQSVDWVIGTFFDTTSRGATSVTLDPQANTSQAFKRNGIDIYESVFTFNGVQYPNFVPNVPEGTVLVNTLQNLNVIQDLIGGCDPAMNDFKRWRTSFFAHVHRFNHLPSGDDDNRLISGINSMGQNAQGEWRTTATTNPAPTGQQFYPTVFVKTTACLDIGPNRTLQVRQ